VAGAPGVISGAGESGASGAENAMVTGAAPLTCWVCRAGVTETTCGETAAAWVAWPAAAVPLARA